MRRAHGRPRAGARSGLIGLAGAQTPPAPMPEAATGRTVPHASLARHDMVVAPTRSPPRPAATCCARAAARSMPRSPRSSCSTSSSRNRPASAAAPSSSSGRRQERRVVTLRRARDGAGGGEARPLPRRGRQAARFLRRGGRRRARSACPACCACSEPAHRALRQAAVARPLRAGDPSGRGGRRRYRRGCSACWRRDPYLAR